MRQIVLCSFGFEFFPYGPELVLEAPLDYAHIEFKAQWGLVLRVSDLEAAFTLKDGTDPEVREQIIEHNKERVKEIVQFVRSTIGSWEHAFPIPGKPYFFAFGCGYGIHRSVAIAEYLAEVLRSEGYDVKVIHLTLEKAKEKFSNHFL